MSGTVLDALAAKAAPTVGATAQRWTEMLLQATETELLPELPAEVQGLVAAALETVRQNETLIADTTAHGFAAIVSHLAMGAEDEARKVWLASAAPFEARMKALDDASSATREERKSRDDTWGAIKTVALDFLEAGGKAALPLLLAFVPI